MSRTINGKEIDHVVTEFMTLFAQEEVKDNLTTLKSEKDARLQGRMRLCHVVDCLVSSLMQFYRGLESTIQNG